MAEVFLTYAREDAAFAGRLADALRSLGVRTFSDSQIGPGQDFGATLRERLRAADGVVMVLSPAGARSANTMFEVGAADALGKQIIAVRKPGPKPDQDVPRFVTRQAILDGTDLADIAERLSQQLAA